MKAKKFITLLFSILFILISIIYSFNYIVDPFSKNSHNLLNITYKITRNSRIDKINHVKTMHKIDNLILGSSRAQKLDPELFSLFHPGISYNFSVGSATLSDHLGILLWLEKINKLPKNIILALDFNNFNDKTPLHPDFLTAKEINFLEQSDKSTNLFLHYLSFNTIRASIKTLKFHFSKIKPKSSFKDNGFLLDDENEYPKKFLKRMKKELNTYWLHRYSSGEYIFSIRNYGYLKQIQNICTNHHINIKIILTPVYTQQLQLIKSHEKLSSMLLNVKKKLSQSTSFYDAMIDNNYTRDSSFFKDSIHTNTKYNQLLLQSIFSKKKTAIFHFIEQKR